MCPRNHTRYTTGIKRVWWQDTPDMTTRLIRYYNSIISPTTLISIRVLTRPALRSIIDNILDLRLFENDNHFITEERYFTTRDDDKTFVLCLQCHTLVQNQNKIKSTTRILGDEHLVLPKSFLYNLLELRTLWCAKCLKKLFNWYTNDDCTHC